MSRNRNSIGMRRSLRIESLEGRKLMAVDLAADPEPHFETDQTHQLVYLDFDGEQNVVYDGPVRIDAFDIPAFNPPMGLPAARESDIIEAIVTRLNDEFAHKRVHFSSQRPSGDELYSTIYVGGDGSAFAAYGDFLGLVERIDVGNIDRTDVGFVFSNAVLNESTSDFGLGLLSHVIGHEVDHLLGASHTANAEHSVAVPSSPISDALHALAFAQGGPDGDGEYDVSRTVHQYLAEQGYLAFTEQFGLSELSDIDLRGAVGVYQPDNTSKPGLLGGSNSTFIEGVFDEDVPNEGPWYDSTLHPSLQHFWTPNAETFERDFDYGLHAFGVTFNSAPNRAIELFTGGFGLTGKFNTDWGTNSRQWEYAGLDLGEERHEGIPFFYDLGHKGTAYYWLGHATHLLQDMALPAHAHGDPHPDRPVPLFGGPDPDPLHEYIDNSPLPNGNGPTRWDAWLDGVDTSAIRSPIEITEDLKRAFLNSPELKSSFPDPDNIDFENANIQLYSLFLETAAFADNFGTKDVWGQEDDRNFDQNDEIEDLTLPDLERQAQQVVPRAIEATAEIIRYFYSVVDDVAPRIDIDLATTTSQAQPMFVNAGASIPIRAVATDVNRGNSGVGKDHFELMVQERDSHGEWGEWQKYTADQISNYEAHHEPDGSAVFEANFDDAKPGHSYRFRVVAHDGAGEQGQTGVGSLEKGLQGDDLFVYVKRNTAGIRIGDQQADDLWIDSQAANRIVIRDVPNSLEEFTITTDGVQHLFLKSEVTSIFMDVGANDDFVKNDTSIPIIVWAGSGQDKVWGGNGDDEIHGGTNKDKLFGRDGNDVIYGDDGNDTIAGNNGIDHLYGGDGNDRIKGGKGRDHIEGGSGNDRLWGGKHNDELRGNEGDDILRGGGGSDTLKGGADNDRLYGGDDGDLLYGQIGSDQLYGGHGDDSLDGGIDDDYLWGGTENDTLVGGYGNDSLHGGEGNDHLHGRSADKDSPYDGRDDRDQLMGDEGNDHLWGDESSDILSGGDDEDFLHGGEGNDFLYGEAGNDVLSGGDDLDYLWGGSENDQLLGGSGDDQLRGDSGDDRLEGGIGNDQYVFEGSLLGSDEIYGSDGTNWLQLADFAYFANIDLASTSWQTIHGGQLRLRIDSSAGIDNVTGTQFDDVIKGNSLSNQLRGEDGNDTLEGGGGDDLLHGFGGNDTYEILRTNAGQITVLDLEGTNTLDFRKFGVGLSVDIKKTSPQSLAPLEGLSPSLVLSSAEAIDNVFGPSSGNAALIQENDSRPEAIYNYILGNHLDNLLISGNLNDRFAGMEGNDIIIGGGGHDMLLGDSGDDHLDGGTGWDWVQGDAGYDRIYSAHDGDFPFGKDFMNGLYPEEHLDGEWLSSERYVLPPLQRASTLTGSQLLPLPQFQLSDGTLILQGTDADDRVELRVIESELRLSMNNVGHRIAIDRVSRIVFRGGEGDDYFRNDSMITSVAWGEHGDDELHGGAGNDLLNGGLGSDQLSGHGGNDTLYGNRGDDQLIGGTGNDVLDGGLDNDRLDSVDGTGGNDQVTESEGDNLIVRDNVIDELNEDFDEEELPLVNFTPIATRDNVSTRSQSKIEIRVLRNDFDFDGDSLRVDSFTQGIHGSVFRKSTDRENVLTYTPKNGFNGTDTFTYVLNDGNGGKATGVVIVDVINGTPITEVDRVTIDQGKMIAIRVLHNDTDPDGDELQLHGYGQGKHGTVSRKSESRPNVLVYQPKRDFSGIERFEYTVADGHGGRSTGLVEITVIANPVPEATLNNGSLQIDGGEGSDQVIVEQSGTKIELLFNDRQESYDAIAVGTITFVGNEGNDQFANRTSIPSTAYGGEGDDHLIGGSTNDILNGGRGADILDGREGDDELFGGLGADKLFGRRGNDLIHGEGGDDEIEGDDGDDRLFGGNGNDNIGGGQGQDELRGNEGDDRLFGNDGHDQVWGGEGNDLLKGGNGNDVLTGETGDDRLEGGSGNDQLDGGDGRDHLLGDLGRDVLFGGKHNDLLEGGDDKDILHGNDGHDVLLGEGGDDKLYGGQGHDELRGGWGHDRLFGGDDNDTLYGGQHNDYLAGDDGDDEIIGGDGDDHLDGGNGHDQLFGELGNDRIEGGDGQDVIDGGEGDDLLFGQDGRDTLHGRRGNDHLNGGNANDVLYGGLGEDYLLGGSGSDLLDGGSGVDKLDRHFDWEYAYWMRNLPKKDQFTESQFYQ